MAAAFDLDLPTNFDPTQTLLIALDRTRSLLAADTATVLRLDTSGDRLTATASVGIEEEVFQGVRIPVGVGFAGKIAATLSPLMVDRVDHQTVVNPLLWEHGLQSLLGVPMIYDEEPIGVVHVGTTSSREFTAEDVALLSSIAVQLAQLSHYATLHEDHAAAMAVQRSLLPAKPPSLFGMDFAARYVPGATEGLGGDWYDVFDLPGSTIGVVMGDVCGQGLDAAIIMGRIRSALRAYALEWPEDPAGVLERVDRKMRHFEPGTMVTVSYAVIDPRRKAVTISLAGHPPPILIHGGAPKFIDARPSLPIGLRGDFPGPRRNTTYRLAEDDLIVCYTDGLIERRGEPVSDGLSRLLDAAQADDPESVCVRLMSRLVGTEAPADDIARLVGRYAGSDR